MKPSIVFMMVCILMGCTRENPFPQDISGDLLPINSSAIMLEVNDV